MTNAEMLLIQALGTKFQWNFKRNSHIFIQENAFEYVVWKMAAILSQPQCINFLGNSVHWLAHPTVINLPADSFCFSRHFGGSIRMPTIRKKKLHTLPPFFIALR